MTQQTENQSKTENQSPERRIDWMKGNPLGHCGDLSQRGDGGVEQVSNCSLRWVLMGFGWAMVGLGVIGIVVPGLPTTVFFLIALWAFSKSSKRFHLWLWTHPRFGPPVQAWHSHKVIPRKAKILAIAMMSASFIYVGFFVAESWALPALLAAIMVPAAAYILSRASDIPVIIPKQVLPVRIEGRARKKP